MPPSRSRPQPLRRAIALSPSPRPNAPVASGEEYDSVGLLKRPIVLGNSAVNVQNVVLNAVVSLVWDPAVGFVESDNWFRSRLLGNPVTGDIELFSTAAPGASRMGRLDNWRSRWWEFVMLALAGPLYASWKNVAANAARTASCGPFAVKV